MNYYDLNISLKWHISGILLKIILGKMDIEWGKHAFPASHTSFLAALIAEGNEIILSRVCLWRIPLDELILFD